MWEELFKDSVGFSKPFISSSKPSPLISIELIANALHGAKLDNTSVKLNYFRGYISGREDYALAETFLSTLPQKEYDIANFIERSFGADNPFFGNQSGLIVNGVLQWSEGLQERTACESKVISQLYSDNMITLDLTLFIGAYGETPFGVHIDELSQRTILFNLGPSTKGVAIWENESIYSQFGFVRNVFNPSQIYALPKKYYFQKGEVFVLPSSQFHLGLNQGVSTTVALVIDIISNGKAIARESQKMFNNIESYENPQRNELMHISAARLLEMHQLRVKSNRLLRYSLVEVNFDMLSIKQSSYLRKTDGFCVEVMKLETLSIVYSRGRHLVLPQFVDAIDFRQFFGLDITCVSDFIAYFAQKGIPLKQALQLIRFLITSRSICVQQ